MKDSHALTAFSGDRAFQLDLEDMDGAHLQEWSTGLFDCVKDPSSCFLQLFCSCCHACYVTHKYGKNVGILFFDVNSLGLLGCLGLPLFVAPASLAMRMDMRHKYGIKGSIYEDLPITCGCLCLSWCQMARELQYQEKRGTVVNMQPSRSPDQHQLQTGVILAKY